MGITKKDLPNILTFSRILAIPVMTLLFFFPFEWAAWATLFVYIPAALTDFFDGYFARAHKTISPIGQFMDPIADKLFVGTMLFLLVAFDRLTGIWVLPAVIIFMREIFIAGLREYLGPMNIQLPVSKMGKWKTAIQMTAIGFLIIAGYNPLEWLPEKLIGQVGLTIAMILTVKSGWQYTVVGLKHITKGS